MSNTLPDWFKPRGYAHFDSPLSRKSAEQLVTDPARVAAHAFFPFLRYTVETQKIERDRTSGKAATKPPKRREISFAAHADSHIYSFYSRRLSGLYEEELQHSGISDNVLAFRSLGKSNIHFAAAAFAYIETVGNCTAFATDIVGFFDNIDHARLKAAWQSLLRDAPLPADHFAVFRSLTQYAYVEREPLYAALGLSLNNPPSPPARICSPGDFRTKVRAANLVARHKDKKGIPQGSPMSALLSNIYLYEFDKALSAEIAGRGGRYFRYCDDILCIVPTSESLGLESAVRALIAEDLLELHPTKTETITFNCTSGRLVASKPLQYLGFTFDGQRKLLRSAAFAKFAYNMRRGVNLARLTARKHNTLKSAPEEIWRAKLYERYSHLGKRNFVRYGLRAADIMSSKSIRRQLKPWWNRLLRRIDEANRKL